MKPRSSKRPANVC